MVDKVEAAVVVELRRAPPGPAVRARCREAAVAAAVPL
jgi:hypothetical protein